MRCGGGSAAEITDQYQTCGVTSSTVPKPVVHHRQVELCLVRFSIVVGLSSIARVLAGI
jgi:hypothetical protein